MRENGLMRQVSKMELAFATMLTDPYMRDNSRKASMMGKADLLALMEMYIQVIGKMEKSTDMANTLSIIRLSTKVTGNKI